MLTDQDVLYAFGIRLQVARESVGLSALHDLEGAVAKLGRQEDLREIITAMGIFSGRHFPREVILWAVRWYCRYGVSYRDLEEMMTSAGACRSITPRFSPLGPKTTPLSWTSTLGGTGRYPTGRPVPGGWMRPISGSAAGGATSDLAITAGGQTLDFYLSPKRNVVAATRFLAKALRSNASAGYPRVINTDKAPSLARAIAELKAEGICPPTVEHRQVKYLNNVIEGDHGRLKRILGPKGAFKNLDICISDVERDRSDALDSRKGQGTMFDLTGNRTRMR